MQHFTKLFKVMELTRSQVQNGYALLGIPKSLLSDLAAHHYLVTFVTWQLARGANRAGGKLNVEKAMEFAMVHDLGEVFGGDIAMPYGSLNKKAKKLAKAFEAENHKYVSKFFGPDAKYVTSLFKEIMDAKTNEGIVAKLADYIESSHFRIYMKLFDAKDFKLGIEKMRGFLKKMKDPAAKKYLLDFVDEWEKNVFDSKSLYKPEYLLTA